MSQLLKIGEKILFEFVDENVFSIPNTQSQSINKLENSYDGTTLYYADKYLSDVNVSTRNVDYFACYERSYPLWLRYDGVVNTENYMTAYSTYKANKIKIHLPSGYDFSDFDGFNVKVYVTDTVKVADFTVLFTNKNIVNNPTPIKIGTQLFGRYIEYDILSTSFLESINKAYMQEIFGVDEIQLPLYKVDFSFINNIDDSQYVSYTLTDNEKFILNTQSDTNSNKLSAFLQYNQDGYIEFCAKHNDRIIEDFISQTNHLTGVDYNIMHSLKIYEQIEMSFILQSEYTINQTSRWSKVFKFRPILENPLANSIMFDYTIYLVNNYDGYTISKHSVLVHENLSDFLPKLHRLDIQPQNFNIFNKIETTKIENNITFPVVTHTNIKYYNITNSNTQTLKLLPYKQVVKILYFDQPQSQNPNDENPPIIVVNPGSGTSTGIVNPGNKIKPDDGTNPGDGSTVITPIIPPNDESPTIVVNIGDKTQQKSASRAVSQKSSQPSLTTTQILDVQDDDYEFQDDLDDDDLNTLLTNQDIVNDVEKTTTSEKTMITRDNIYGDVFLSFYDGSDYIYVPEIQKNEMIFEITTQDIKFISKCENHQYYIVYKIDDEFYGLTSGEFELL